MRPEPPDLARFRPSFDETGQFPGGNFSFYTYSQEAGEFTTWVLDENITQAGAMKIEDLDGDGKAELVVSGYDANVVYIYTHDEEGTSKSFI